ncbi:MAG: YbhB/YbcL family Raf kinase inhibitor-like protein [Proteobacteria bacterium]|nr:YbhB/YbcL family Raf kinase inhibitor-like protein [Pseudomonadota bacterium]
MKISSTAFVRDAKIPAKYTCEGADISPDLAWEGIPEKTKTLALIMDDPDAPAGTWVHWVVYNIPATVHAFPAHVPVSERLDNGALQGRNSFRKIGYGGPCPPPEHGPHRYFFLLYALDIPLDLKAGASKEDLKAAMSGHILEQAELMGRFER